LKSVFRLVSMGLALVIGAGVALGPDLVMRRVDEAVTSSWQALGDYLAERELDSIARQLDHGRQITEQIKDLRDELAARLLSLEAGRERVEVCAREGSPPQGVDLELELAGLNDSIKILRSAVARADRKLDRSWRELREREGVLTVLRATADVRRMDRALSEPVSDPSRWNVRVARARDFLRTTLPDGERLSSRSARSGPP
jgi:hypothetical protein